MKAGAAAAIGNADKKRWSDIRWSRFVFWLIVGSIFMVGTLFGWHRTEEFLIRDDRFRVAEADDIAGQSPNLIIGGVHYASPAQIRHVFAPDFGLSLYLVPLAQRRSELLAVDWVEEATVSKVWPNTLSVHVKERTPVAFVHLTPNRRDGMSQFALVDRDGVILRPRVASKFTLPVMTGIEENERVEDRRTRVRRMLSMLKAIGPQGDQISEINVADPNDLIVSERVGKDVVNLMLGNENYSERLRSFQANYSEIHTKRPHGRAFDLRVDGEVTAVGEGVGRGEQ
ncbi:MAG: FtsQ-type POTRA domain-containing protein [Rhodospirillales bacterium]|nr:FtsQ-type POTRA domain-containing protein [Acetobacter sp.]